MDCRSSALSFRDLLVSILISKTTNDPLTIVSLELE